MILAAWSVALTKRKAVVCKVSLVERRALTYSFVVGNDDPAEPVDGRGHKALLFRGAEYLLSVLYDVGDFFELGPVDVERFAVLRGNLEHL
jgi:hypothetical protein